jgi:CBS domain-containing protein
VIVREALVADPPILQAGEPVPAAAALLAKPHVESVLVAEGEQLLGSITKEAIVSAVADSRDLRSLTVGDVADRDVPTVGPETALEDALLLMVEQGLERLPVVEDGRLLGILPREPVLRRLAEDEPPPESGDPRS